MLASRLLKDNARAADGTPRRRIDPLGTIGGWYRDALSAFCSRGRLAAPLVVLTACAILRRRRLDQLAGSSAGADPAGGPRIRPPRGVGPAGLEPRLHRPQGRRGRGDPRALRRVGRDAERAGRDRHLGPLEPRLSSPRRWSDWAEARARPAGHRRRDQRAGWAPSSASARAPFPRTRSASAAAGRACRSRFWAKTTTPSPTRASPWSTCCRREPAAADEPPPLLFRSTSPSALAVDPASTPRGGRPGPRGGCRPPADVALARPDRALDGAAHRLYVLFRRRPAAIEVRLCRTPEGAVHAARRPRGRSFCAATTGPYGAAHRRASPDLTEGESVSALGWERETGCRPRDHRRGGPRGGRPPVPRPLRTCVAAGDAAPSPRARRSPSLGGGGGVHGADGRAASAKNHLFSAFGARHRPCFLCWRAAVRERDLRPGES